MSFKSFKNVMENFRSTASDLLALIALALMVVHVAEAGDFEYSNDDFSEVELQMMYPEKLDLLIDEIRKAVESSNLDRLVSKVDADEARAISYLKMISKHFQLSESPRGDGEWRFETTIRSDDFVMVTVKFYSSDQRVPIQRPIDLRYLDGEWRIWFGSRGGTLRRNVPISREHRRHSSRASVDAAK